MRPDFRVRPADWRVIAPSALDAPLIMTLHTLERFKAGYFERESEGGAHREAPALTRDDEGIASCAGDASQSVESYIADPARVHVALVGA